MGVTTVSPSSQILRSRQGSSWRGGGAQGVIDVGDNPPPGKSRRRRQQGCRDETFPIHHPLVGRTSTLLGGDAAPPPCWDEATEDPAKGRGQGQVRERRQGRAASPMSRGGVTMHRHQGRRKDRGRKFISRAGEGEEGLEKAELPVPGQQQSRPSSFPIPPALTSHLGKVKISRKRLQIGLTPPLPLNKVYYRPGSNPFKSPGRGEGPGLGEGSVIPMNLLQGDLGSAGRADGPSPSSGKQPFSVMIPNKDKRAERIGDRRRGPAPTEVPVPGGMQGCSRKSPCSGPQAWPAPNCSSMAHANFVPGASCPPTQAPSSSPCFRTSHKPPQPRGHAGCMGVSRPWVHSEAKSRRKCTIITFKII